MFVTRIHTRLRYTKLDGQQRKKMSYYIVNGSQKDQTREQFPNLLVVNRRVGSRSLCHSLLLHPNHGHRGVGEEVIVVVGLIVVGGDMREEEAGRDAR